MDGRRVVRWATISAVVLAISAGTNFLINNGQSTSAVVDWTPSNDSKSAGDSSVDGTESRQPARAARRDPAPLRSASLASGNNALDFDESNDLYLLASSAAGSTEPRELVNGWYATNTCISVKDDLADYESAASYVGPDQGLVAVARSARLALSRCRGFVNNDRSANADLRSRIAARIAMDGKVYAVGITEGPVTKVRFLAAIETGDWKIFELARGDFLPVILARHGVDIRSQEALLWGVAYMQAPCDLGKNCSGDGLTYATFCVPMRLCLGSLEKHFNEGLAPAHQERVAAIRESIVDAYRRKDAGFFGLRN